MKTVPAQELHSLIATKLTRAGLKPEHASGVAEVLVHADARGVHSHGAMRTEYYAERIAKGGTNRDPQFSFHRTGPSTAVLDGDNGAGHVVAKLGMEHAISLAEESGVGVVGVRRMGHSGALSYYATMAARRGLIGLSVCQSDPMAVPFGGAEPYYGTNPIAFAVPAADGCPMVLDMATTISAWGKILHARTLGAEIPSDWAVDKGGRATTDPHAVNALVPMAGPKGYGISMMVDVLSGILLGLPFGKHVTSMYRDLTEARELGQTHIVLNPSFFTSVPRFLADVQTSREELTAIRAAPGFDRVQYPGQPEHEREVSSQKEGVQIAKEIYRYLVSDKIHSDRFDNKGAFSS